MEQNRSRRTSPLNARGPLIARCVVIDGPGVLFDNTIWNRWLFRLLQHVGLQSEFEVFFRLWDEEYQADVANGHIEYWQALRRFLRESGMKTACVDEVIVAGQSRRDQMECPACPTNGVAGILRQLKLMGYGLAAVGDGFDISTPLSTRLVRWRLAQFFDHIESADQLAASWPTRLNARGDSPESSVFLSRNARRLREARDAGWQTIALGVWDLQANLVIHEIDELIPCLTLGQVRLAS